MTIALLTLAVALFGILANHRLAAFREKRASFRSAALSFRAAFADALLNLVPQGAATSTVLRNSHVGHIAAINAFRPHLGFLRRNFFNRKVIVYQELAEQYLALGPLEAFASEQNNAAQEKRKELLSSIESLLSYSKIA